MRKHVPLMRWKNHITLLKRRNGCSGWGKRDADKGSSIYDVCTEKWTQCRSLVNVNLQKKHGGSITFYRVTMVVVHSGLGITLGWWAASAATYCPTGEWNIPNLSQPNPGARPPWSSCTLIICFGYGLRPN